MKIPTHLGELAIVDERAFTFGSADNVRIYPVEVFLRCTGRPVSVHGLLLDGTPLAVFGAAAGATGVHEHSAVWLRNKLFLAICDLVVCVELNPVRVRWTLHVDQATCFGIYFHEPSNSLVSHGELAITRFSEAGSVVWQVGGPDSFTGQFVLGTDHLTVEDFNGHIHRFRFEDGSHVA